MKADAVPVKSSHSRDSLHQRLQLYALAAGAAGVSLLALSRPTEAEIIWKSGHVVLDQGGKYDLDLTGDGTIDFEYNIAAFWESDFFTINFWAQPEVAGNGFMGGLKKGASIGSQGKFLTQGYVMASALFVANAPYTCLCDNGFKALNQLAYQGLRFNINGETHYGWAHWAIHCRARNGSLPELWAELYGYAYETIPNQGLKAGQRKGDDDSLNPATEPLPSGHAPATLGALARGAGALSAWRQK